MERNLKEPSLEALRRLSECLECSIVWLILDSPHSLEDGVDDRTGYLVRASERRVVIMPEIGTRYEFFTPESVAGSAPRITGSYMRLAPGRWASEKAIVHMDLEESLYLVQGGLEARLGSKTLFLEPGDNLYIPSGTPHNLKSSGDTAAVVLVHMSAVIG